MTTSELSSLLRTAISTLHKGLRKQLSVAKTYSMTELETIALLSRNSSLMPTELAAMTRITTQSMSQILAKLEKEKIIKKTPSEEDKRKVYISITTSGKKMVEKTRYEGDKWLNNAIEKSLTEKEKVLLIKILPVLNKLTEYK